MPDGLRLALTTLTVVPVRGPSTIDRRTAGRAMELAPLVGLLLGLVAAAVVFLLRLGSATPLLAAAVGVAVLALLTRGLHLDGLADLADGLGSYRDPEGTRAVMKASDVGPLGLVTVVLSLLVQVAALESCVRHGRGTASLVVAVVTARAVVALACSGPDAATPDGLGALVARTVRRPVAVAWLLGVATLGAAYAFVDPDGRGDDGQRALANVVAVLLTVAVTQWLQRHAVRRVGGLTGDVLGALSEVATTVALLVLALGWG